MLHRAMELDRMLTRATGGYDQQLVIIVLEALAMQLQPGTAYTARDLERIAEAFPAYESVVRRRDAELAQRRYAAAGPPPVRVVSAQVSRSVDGPFVEAPVDAEGRVDLTALPPAGNGENLTIVTAMTLGGQGPADGLTLPMEPAKTMGPGDTLGVTPRPPRWPSEHEGDGPHGR